MKISVAMTTYNGARFLAEQLDSILAQSRLPDELVVCDDCSTDATEELLRNYAARSPFRMTVIANDNRLGVIKNFEKAIDLCSGDLIALCDQDDVWRPQKLAIIESAFAMDPEVGAILSNADLINENGTLLPGDLWTRARFNRRRQQALKGPHRYDLLLGLPFATGATMAFRSHFKALVLPIPAEAPTFFHDRWIAVLIAAIGHIAIIPDKLTAYRLHRQQQLGVGLPLALKALIPHHCRSDAAALASLGRRLRDNSDYPANPDFSHSLADRQRHVAERAKFSRNPFRRVLQVASEFRSGRYILYPYGWIVPLQDLLVGTR